MLVFTQARLVFLSVPKTGSTAYHAALAPHASIAISAPPELKHAPLFRYNRFMRPMLAKFLDGPVDVLAVMREPVDWLGSWYRYRRRAELAGQPNTTYGLSFNEFAEAYAKNTRPAFANVGSQARFLQPTPNGTAVTHLFRYEDQVGLKRFLENRLQISFETKLQNVSPGTAPQLSPDIAAKLRRAAADDFALWEGIRQNGVYTPLCVSV